jgi:hypothetical protein
MAATSVDCAPQAAGVKGRMAGVRFGAGFRGLSVWALVCAGLSACASDAVRGVALYPPEPPRLRREIALLIGPVETVDGRNVGAQGPIFELLPGCHIVELGDSVGQIGERESLAALSSARVYAFRMRAGHTYRIDVPRGGTPSSAYPTSGNRTVAREENEHGQVAFVPLAMSSYDLNACRQWVP